MTTSRLHIAEVDVAMWETSSKPELPPRFEASIPALVEQSGIGATWWSEGMTRAIPFWFKLVDDGLDMDAPSLRVLGTGIIGNLVQAHLGRPVPAVLSEEFGRRIEEEGDPERRQVWCAIQSVVAASSKAAT